MFAFMVSCLIILLVINVCAKKYLRGDYAKVDGDDDNDVDDVIYDENEAAVDIDVTDRDTKASPYCEVSPDEINQNIPGVTVSLRYYQSTCTIEGVVKNLMNASYKLEFLLFSKPF